MSSAMRYLSKSVNNNILISLKNGIFIRGVLRAYDNHLNLILDNVEEIYTSPDGETKQNRIGKRVLIRGDNIIAISTPNIEESE